MRFMIEKSPMVTKFIGGFGCIGGNIYNSDNMPFNASVGTTKIKKEVLTEMSTKYPEIKIFNKDDELIVDKIKGYIDGGQIKNAFKWDQMVSHYKVYLESINKNLKDIEEMEKKE